MKKAASLIAILIAMILSVPVCAAQEKHTADFFAMDTHISITAYANDAGPALEEAQALLKEREQIWSVTLDSSEISAVNRANGAEVSVSAATADILQYALEMAEITGGAYDPTIYPLVSAWGFTTGNYRIPAQDEIAQKLQLIDYGAVSVREDRVKLAAGMQMDLGGIAKGYAGDELSRLLKQRGVHSAMLSLGGNIHVIGGKLDGSAWRIGVKSPMDDSLIGVLSVRDRCVITSGAYERYFMDENQRRYGHIIDPDTGYPADNGVLSVTVVGTEGAKCDALSTALFVMGVNDACGLWASRDDFDMIVLTDDGVLYVTEGIADSLEVKDSALIGEVCVVER